jgi:predicted metal-dependent HD superfamily phosphohydrolase
MRNIGPKLKKRWQLLWSVIGAKGDPALRYFELCRRYCEPHREYHTLGHIDSCLTLFRGASYLADIPEAVELAIWYHDAIYDVGKRDNEERSAELANSDVRGMGFGAEFAGHVAELVLATKHDVLPTGNDAKLIVDADLFSLSLPWPRFERNTALIRKEYAAFSDKDFRAGRIKFLRSFLARPSIYCTDLFRGKYEARARANLRRSLEEFKKTTRG